MRKYTKVKLGTYVKQPYCKCLGRVIGIVVIDTVYLKVDNIKPCRKGQGWRDSCTWHTDLHWVPDWVEKLTYTPIYLRVVFK